eukprot:Tbor_TRINITY_DN5333_c0_g6::TRINITY_DN5333_c0_g6_i2::g.4767::m.4767
MPFQADIVPKCINNVLSDISKEQLEELVIKAGSLICGVEWDSGVVNMILNEENVSNDVDAVSAIAFLYAHAIRLHIPIRDTNVAVNSKESVGAKIANSHNSAFADFLLHTTMLSSDQIDVLSCGYDAIPSFKCSDGVTAGALVADNRESQQQQLVDGPYPRLTGLKWAVSHKLGNRTVDPPERSVPSVTLDFQTSTTSTVADINNRIRFNLSQEEAHDMLAQFRDLVKESERIQSL